MLKRHNIKRQFTLGITALIIPLLSIGSLTYLTFTPESVHAAEDTKTIDDITYMQEMSPHVCASMQESTATVDNGKILIDYRDKKSYKVDKLKDGNCWMTQNLRLVGPKILTSVDSNIASDYQLPASMPISSDDNPKHFTSSDQNSSLLHYAGNITNGAYYNFYTATAGTGDASATTDGVNASSSICSKGWQLPTSTDKSYAKLLDGLTAGSTITVSPYYFVYGGDVNNSSLNYAGVYGGYWSSTPLSSTNAYGLYFNNTNIYPSIGNIRYIGYSVRCVASDTFYNWQAPEEDNANINVTIPTILTVEAASNIDSNVTPNNITNGTITATVSSNTEYNIFLSAEEPNLINSKDPTGPNIPANINVSPNTNAWAIKNDSTGNTYKAIKTTTDTFYNTKTTDALGNDIYTYGLGISIAPSLPAGTYSTTVTITAFTK